MPAAIKWLPFTGLPGALTQETPDLFSPAVAGLLMVLSLSVALAVGIAVTMARDVE